MDLEKFEFTVGILPTDINKFMSLIALLKSKFNITKMSDGFDADYLSFDMVAEINVYKELSKYKIIKSLQHYYE